MGAKQGLKCILREKLDTTKGLWDDKLLQILCSYCTTTKIALGEIPFYLPYGMEATVQVEIYVSSSRRIGYEKEQDVMAINVNLDLLEEKRDNFQDKLAIYQKMLERYLISKVHKKIFKVGDLRMYLS